MSSVYPSRDFDWCWLIIKGFWRRTYWPRCCSSVECTAWGIQNYVVCLTRVAISRWSAWSRGCCARGAHLGSGNQLRGPSSSWTNFNAKTVNSDSSSRLTASLTTPNATYNGTDAITVFAVEGRNENALYVVILFFYFERWLMRILFLPAALSFVLLCVDFVPPRLYILLTLHFPGSRTFGWNFASIRHPSCAKGC